MTELRSISNSKQIPKIESKYLGRTDYSESLTIQQELKELVLKNRIHYVIGLEHPAVVTMGYRANDAEEIFEDNKIPIVKINRGGLATIHSEGQLVVYPILHLRDLNLGVKAYILLLLQTTQDVLADLGVKSTIDEKCIGLYTPNGKIAFCGVQVQNGVTQHGLSLNVRNDLDLFVNIRSCGQAKSTLDNLSRYQINLPLQEIYDLWVHRFNINLAKIKG